MRQIFLDTETTGLSPDSGDRIIEIGCIEMVNRRLTGENKHFYLNPERKNSEDAVRVHGLTDEFLADKPVFAAVADELMDYLAGAEVVIVAAGSRSFSHSSAIVVRSFCLRARSSLAFLSIADWLTAAWV